MSLQEQSEDLLKEILQRYYSSFDLSLPEDFLLREFAFQNYRTRKYVRHLSFTSLASLREYLVKETPRNSYYSVALYRDPAAERMDDKGLIGAELLFDIDVDHIKGCRSDTITLEEGPKIHVFTPECIELGKEHELRLLDILKNDFGFSKDEIEIYFTGNRGFHTVVRPKDNEWLNLTSSQRRELIDYIKGIGLKITRILPPKIKLDQRIAESGGWRRRLFSLVDPEEARRLPPAELVENVKVEIDEQVTQDLSRLIRIRRTINGKSGLPSIPFSSESQLISFTYGIHLSPFKGEAMVKSLVNLPSLTLSFGTEINLVKGQTLLVPLPIGVYLQLNDLAKIIRVM
ncbi:MAG TPA: hypothetical protein ENF42_04050 [Candidatus Bathyarchaeota archaeon]|nr:hypothetical protein [Candidatus Bathyarchaeota archaeon]